MVDVVNATRTGGDKATVLVTSATGEQVKAQAVVLVGASGIARDPTAASGATAVTGSFVATGQSASFSPVSGRSFNMSLRGTFVGTVQIERKFTGDANWYPITALGTSITFTAPMSEAFDEAEAGVTYRLNCTSWTSGTISYRISQ